MAGYYLILNSSGAPIGAGTTPDSTVPSGSVVCTAAEAASWWLCSISGGVVTLGAAPSATLAQQAATAVYNGFTVALSGSITLASTPFPTDPTTQGKMAAVVTTLTATGTFPGGATSYPLKDTSGAWHTFTVSQYKTVAGAIAGYVAALDLIIDGNPTGATALPANSVSLAV